MIDEVSEVMGWMRRHIRKCFWLRWSTPQGRLNALPDSAQDQGHAVWPTVGRGHGALLVYGK